MSKCEIIYHKKGPKKGKINKILHDDYPDFFFWNYEEQTKVKHKVLYEYLKVWFTKLGVGGQNINYYDGFSGCGAYYDYNNYEIGWGSPIIAHKAAIDTNRSLNCKFYFNEYENENIKNLKEVINYNKILTINNIYSQDTFNNNINNFLDKLEKNPVPTFFMIDPYGIDVNFEVIKRIMQIPKTEVLLNFMYNFFNRFITNSQNEDAINKFYGNTNWQEFRKYNGQLKESSLVNLYREQLKEFSKYVYQYRLSFSEQNKTYYYLFHMTQNINGCLLMKRAFSKINNGNVDFLGPRQPNPTQMPLLNDESLIVNELKVKLFEYYRGKTVNYDDIMNEFIDNSPYLDKHIKLALENMKDTHLKVIRNVPNTRTFQNGYIFEFYTIPVKKEQYIQQKLVF